MLFNSFQYWIFFLIVAVAVLQHPISRRESATPLCKLCFLHVVGSAVHRANPDLHGS